MPENPPSDTEAACEAASHVARLLFTFAVHSISLQKEKMLHVLRILLGHCFHVVFSLALNKNFSYCTLFCVVICTLNLQGSFYSTANIVHENTLNKQSNCKLCTWPMVKTFFFFSFNTLMIVGFKINLLCNKLSTRHAFARTRYHCSCVVLV